MPVSCTPGNLIDQSACFTCLTSEQKEAIKTYLLAVQNGGSTEPFELMELSKCFLCFEARQLKAIQTWLLCQIANNGGGGTPGELTFIATVIDIFELNQDNADTSLNFPNLTQNPTEFNLFSNTALTEVLLPVLASIGEMTLLENTALTVFYAPLLTTATSVISIQANPLLAQISFPSLTSALGFTVTIMDSLTAINIPLLETSTNGITATDCLLLTTVNFPVWIPTDGSLINFAGSALTASTIETIFSKCVAAGVTTCTIDVSGGTNAPLASLSAQGQADCAALITAGNTVTTN